MGVNQIETITNTQRAYSIRIRIKTCNNRGFAWCRSKLREYIPLQQGLRLADPVCHYAVNSLKEHIPLE